MKLTGKRCQCCGCDKYFKSEAGFNKHRVGKSDRRCLSTQEMIDKGMVINYQGWWVTEPGDPSFKHREADG